MRATISSTTAQIRNSQHRQSVRKLIGMSPTVFRERGYRFFFFSREEARMHVHVMSPNGEAKYWLEPEIALARSTGLSPRELARIGRIIKSHEIELHHAWNIHFRR